MQAPHAQRPAATRHLCRCLWFQTLILAQRPFQHGEVQSVRQSNKGVPMFCPFAKAQATALWRHVRPASSENTAQGEPRCQRAKGPASCFVLAANANRSARQTAPNAMLPSLPAGCFESTTRFSVFLRVVGDMASTVFSSMLASPCPCGNNSALMLVADPHAHAARESGGAHPHHAHEKVSPPDPHGTTDSGTSVPAPSGRSPSVRAFFF